MTEAYKKYFAHLSKATQVANANKLMMFCQWFDKKPEQLIKEFNESEDRDVYIKQLGFKVEEWIQTLKAKYAINTYRVMPNGIRSFSKRYLRPLTISNIPKPQVATGEHKFLQDELRAMFYYGDSTEKAMISLAVSLGYASQDFLELECAEIAKYVSYGKKQGYKFVQFQNNRIKTSMPIQSILTTEALQSVENYLLILQKRSKGKLPKYLWCNGNPTEHIDNDTLNKRFRNLVEKSNINLKGKVSFHLIRKFVYTTLHAINPVIADIILGKSVDLSKVTYIQNIESECLRVFTKAYNKTDGNGLSLNGEMTLETKRRKEQQIKQLENAIIQLRITVTNQDTINNVLSKQLAKLKDQMFSTHREISKLYSQMENLRNQPNQKTQQSTNLRNQTNQKNQTQ